MLDVKRAVYSLLKGRGCTMVEREGITFVTAPDGKLWSFTIPMPEKKTPKIGEQPCGAYLKL